MEKYIPLVSYETQPVSENKKKYSFVIGLVLIASVIAVGVISLGSSSSQETQEFVQLDANNGFSFNPVPQITEDLVQLTADNILVNPIAQVTGDLFQLNADNGLLDKSTNLGSGASQIYRHYARNADGSGYRYFYSFYSYLGNGWTYDTTAFLAYSYAASGTVPVYIHYQINSNNDVSYAFSIYSPSSGYSYSGYYAFYAYSYYASNTKPIYQYYAYFKNGSLRYFYSDGSNVPYGWTYQGVAFYVPIS
jgi:hypothetical protein